jgi:hypothetical protein
VKSTTGSNKPLKQKKLDPILESFMNEIGRVFPAAINLAVKKEDEADASKAVDRRIEGK